MADDSTVTGLLSTGTADSASNASFQSSASLIEEHLSFTDFPLSPWKYRQAMHAEGYPYVAKKMVLLQIYSANSFSELEYLHFQ